jgi:hypothetical protein
MEVGLWIVVERMEEMNVGLRTVELEEVVKRVT